MKRALVHHPHLRDEIPCQGHFWERRDTYNTQLLCQQGCRETFPAIASAPQMGATTGFSKLFFNRPTKNLMQGNSGTILFILGVILNVLKVGKALNRT